MGRALPDDATTEIARLRLALDAAALGVWDWDVRTGDLVWDSRIAELHGVDAGTFDGTMETFLSRVHPDDQQGLQHAITDALARCSRFLHEFRVLRPDGTTAWVQGRGQVLCEGGAPSRMIGVGADTTVLHDVRERVGRTLEHVSDGVIVLDTDWRVVFANGPAARLLRSDPDEVRDQTLWEQFPEAVDSPFWELYQRAMTTQEPETLEAYYGPLDGWFEVRAFPAPDGLTVYFRSVEAERRTERERAELIDRLSAALARNRQRLALTRSLAGVLTDKEVADAVTRHTAQALGSLFAGIALVDQERHVLRFMSMAPLSDTVAREWTEIPLGAAVPPVDALHHDRMIFRDRGEIVAKYPHIAADLEEAGTQAMVTLPLDTPTGPIGVLVVTWGEPRDLDEDEVRFLDILAGQCAQAIERSTLFARQRSAAQALQRGILPSRLPSLDHLALSARYQSAEGDFDVGGDWYDAFELPDGTVMLTVGDVGGHGINAAAIMGQLRNATRAYALDGDAPSTIATKLNRLLDYNDEGTYATMLCAAFDPRTEMLAWANAGHMPPVLVGPGQPTMLEEVHGPMLGVDPGTPLAESATRLAAGATLVLYTDGLLEHRSRSITDGLDTLLSVVDGAAAGDLDWLSDRLMNDVLPPDAARDDDVALLIARRTPPAG